LKRTKCFDAKNNQNETSLAVVRDVNNTVVALGGQAVAPESSAKVYWNKETQVVYVDAAGLPEPQRNGVSGLGSKIKSFNTNKYRIIRQI
jgi:hypothetical protein